MTFSTSAAPLSPEDNDTEENKKKVKLSQRARAQKYEKENFPPILSPFPILGRLSARYTSCRVSRRRRRVQKSNKHKV